MNKDEIDAARHALKSKLLEQSELAEKGVPDGKVATPVVMGGEILGYVLEPIPDPIPIPTQEIKNGAAGEEGEAEWARLKAMVGSGKHPTMKELATALFFYGVAPASDAAQYIAGRMVGDIKAPQGNDGQPRLPTTDDWIIWHHTIATEELEIQRKVNPSAYLEEYGKRTPWVVAHEITVKRLKENFPKKKPIAVDTVRKIVNKHRQSMAVEED